MSFVVDASVAIKWFIDEPLHENARHLLKSRQSLHAPDLLLAEVGNIAWKKAIRSEIGEEQAQKIALSLRDLPLVLLPSSELIDRALQIALSIKHPVYDCLYLACAESLGSTLVTADERLIRNLAGTPFAMICRSLEDRYNIALSEKEIEELIRQFKKVEETWKHIDESLYGGTGLDTVERSDVNLHLDNPVFLCIRKSIQALSEAQKVDLEALSWLGAGHSGRNWLQLQENVRNSSSFNSDNDLIYLVRLSAHFEAGWRKFQKMASAEATKK